MSQETIVISTLDDLRGFVERTICDRQFLLLGSFQFREKVLVRHGQPCGLHFILSGPRAVQYSAIWDVVRQTVLFYDCSGGRFHRCELAAAARLRKELAELVRLDVKLAA